MWWSMWGRAWTTWSRTCRCGRGGTWRRSPGAPPRPRSAASPQSPSSSSKPSVKIVIYVWNSSVCRSSSSQFTVHTDVSNVVMCTSSGASIRFPPALQFLSRTTLHCSNHDARGLIISPLHLQIQSVIHIDKLWYVQYFSSKLCLSGRVRFTH